MSAAAYDAFVRACQSSRSNALLGDLDGTWTRPQSLSAAERIAARVDAMLGDTRRGAMIAVLLPRDRRYLATLFAVWARGDAFVPLNQQWPEAHLKRVLEIARPDVVITDAARAGIDAPLLILPEHDAVLNMPEPTAEQQVRWATCRQAARLSYAIFTSGSTGDQKGVLISADAYAAYVDWTGRYWPTPSDYRALLISSELTFDMALGDIAFALAHGIEMHVSPQSINLFAHAKLIRDRNIDVLFSVPSTISRLLALARLRDDVVLGGLRLVVSGGDAFPPLLIEQLKQGCPGTEFYNVYGPTEVTINCMANRVDNQQVRIAAAGFVPIGLPFDHLQALLIDEETSPELGWPRGELLIGGRQCMEGYLGDPAGTQRAFAEIGGRKYYRTGDLVMRDPDGYHYVLGRKDSLVKVKGYRVNPVSVDAVLIKEPSVREARTILVRDADDGGRLFAFVAAPPDAPIAALMQRCRMELPTYAVPERIIVVDTLPVNSSGKHDLKALRDSLG